MKASFHYILIFTLLSIFASCTINENYRFNSDMSGHYSFQFDYSALLEFDTSGSANAEMEKGYLEMENELKKIDGIKNILILSDGEEGKVIVSYDFDNLEALNQTNFDQESGKYSKLFTLHGNKFYFTTDFSEEMKNYTDPNMSVEELKENIQTMLDYTIHFQFENKIKVINTSNIEQVDDYSLSYTLNEEGLSNPSNFELKLK